MALPTATAYLSAADADAYFATSFNAAAWTALSSAEKTVALAEATRWLETLCWKGEKCSDTQPLQWPRKADADGCCGAVACAALPEAMVQATAELALGLHQNKTAIIGGSTSTGTTGAIKSQKLGDLQQDYYDVKDGQTTTGKVSSTAPLILQRFSWLIDLLAPCYLEGSFGRSRIISRTCC
jgi:hypothetical protein